MADADGAIRYASPGIGAVLGWSADELEGRSILDLLTDEHRTLADQALRELLGQPRASEEAELRCRHREGGVHLLRVCATNLLDDPQVAGIVVNAHDITEARHVEDQLRHAQKMEAVGRLAGGVAHDFNNILTAINGFAELLRESLPDDDVRCDDVAEIVKAAQRGAGLSRQLLAFSRREPGRSKVVDLNRVVREAEGMLRPLLGEDVELRLDLAADLAAVRIDPLHLHQVILNLALNARDALPAGGRITLRTGWATAAVEHGGGRRLLLSVTDDGTGMSDEVLQRIFEPFFTTKPSGHGTGLGLSTVYGIVRQAGGHVWVYSEPGHGTVFKVYLPPAQQADGDGQTEEAQEDAPHAGEGLHVLVVEDDDAIRPLVARILRRRGYRVTEAHDGAEGLTAAEATDAPIDLVASDVVMPAMGGPDMLKRLREARPDLPVLFLSGYSADEVAARGSLDAPFLEKPFEGNELLRAVRLALDGAAGQSPKMR